MSEPLWLTLEQVILVHKKMIDLFGGTHGIRDEGLLQSALARPLNIYSYQDGDVFECAAAYAEGITRNHPFIDGNKRTAFISASVFLAENGLSLKPQQEKNHENIMVEVAEKRITLPELAKYLREQTESEM
jgi:death-on-curing protein